ncbi:hypothetical protein Tco_0138231 [Tanacetum coccineum]
MMWKNHVSRSEADMSKVHKSVEPSNAVDVTAIIEQTDCDRVEKEKAQLQKQRKALVSLVTLSKTKVLAPWHGYAYDVNHPHPLQEQWDCYLQLISPIKESVEPRSPSNDWERNSQTRLFSNAGRTGHALVSRTQLCYGVTMLGLKSILRGGTGTQYLSCRAKFYDSDLEVAFLGSILALFCDIRLGKRQEEVLPSAKYENTKYGSSYNLHKDLWCGSNGESRVLTGREIHLSHRGMGNIQDSIWGKVLRSKD